MKHWLILKFENNLEKIAIVDNNGSHSYQDLLDKIEDFTPQINENISSGDIVMLLSNYSLESIALLLACINLNLIIVPIASKNQNSASKQQDIEEKIGASNTQFLLTLDKSKLSIKKPSIKKPSLKNEQLEENQLCSTIKTKNHSGLILFSSGSTGKPKAMLHDLTKLLGSYQNKKSKQISILIFLLFDHIGGINTLFNVLSMGAKAVIPESRDAESIAKIIEQEKVKILPTSPTFMNLFLLADVATKYDLSSIRMITYGTETMPESLLNRIKLAFPKAKLLQTFGTSETGIAQVNSRSSKSLDIKIDDPNLDYKIVDGELWLKSKTQILGYLNASMDSFTKDGWFCTGDLVKQSDDGYFKIIGRSKEVINVGGEKVLPAEVESLLLTIDGVKDCMVYAKPNSITGQTVVADIVKSTSVDTKLLKTNIRKICFKKLERFKIPTKLNFVEQLQIGERFKKMRIKS